jgi:hypothetical protein
MTAGKDVPMAVLGTGHEVVNKLPAETRGGTEPGSGQSKKEPSHRVVRHSFRRRRHLADTRVRGRSRHAGGCWERETLQSSEWRE